MSLRIYVLILVGGAIVFASLDIPDHAVGAVISVLLAIVIASYILVGSRIAWFIAAAAQVVGLVEGVMSDRPWWSIPFVLLALGCLFAPSARRFVWSAS